MITENLATLKINRLTQEQYDAALQAGAINDNEFYLTPDDNELDTTTFLRVTDVGSAVDTNPINAGTLGGKAASAFAPINSPAFTGAATVAAGSDYTTAKLRNVILSTANPSGGNNGDIWIKYKA